MKYLIVLLAVVGLLACGQGDQPVEPQAPTIGSANSGNVQFVVNGGSDEVVIIPLSGPSGVSAIAYDCDTCCYSPQGRDLNTVMCIGDSIRPGGDADSLYWEVAMLIPYGRLKIKVYCDASDEWPAEFQEVVCDENGVWSGVVDLEFPKAENPDSTVYWEIYYWYVPTPHFNCCGQAGVQVGGSTWIDYTPVGGSVWSEPTHIPEPDPGGGGHGGSGGKIKPGQD